MYPVALALSLMAGACSTTPPPLRYPLPPEELLVEPPPLEALPNTPQVTPADAVSTVVRNYGLYHEVAARLRRLQQWTREAAR